MFAGRLKHVYQSASECVCHRVSYNAATSCAFDARCSTRRVDEVDFESKLHALRSRREYFKRRMQSTVEQAREVHSKLTAVTAATASTCRVGSSWPHRGPDPVRCRPVPGGDAVAQLQFDASELHADQILISRELCRIQKDIDDLLAL